MFFNSIRSTSRGLVIAGVTLVLLFAFAIAPGTAQNAQTAITKSSGDYVLKLKLPDNGIEAGVQNNFEFRISMAAASDDPVGVALVTARLTMPAMAGMTMAQPTVTGAIPGVYHVMAMFPHAGEYQLELAVKPVIGKALNVAFMLKAQVGMGPAKPSGTNTNTITDAMTMMNSISGVSEMQQASGTSWQPSITPMYGVHSKVRKWMVMTHYNVSVNYDQQTGPRGDYQYNSTNWLMVMGNRPIGRDTLQLRTMLTLEPLTVTPRGYPLLFQSGEQYDGKPIVDRQHPHDLFMELASRYTHPVSSDSALYIYAAPSGEPALGPSAFMHRLSAFDMPMAPITHHWMDSTHIDFGVVTLGGWKRNFQLETSYFTGREPDQYRYEIGPIHMDSFSGRLSYNPSANWSTQISYGYLHSPEALEPGQDVRRTTASASYVLPIRRDGWWALTMGIGNNSSNNTNSTALLLETELNIAQRNSVFARYEYVNKLGEELALTPAGQGNDIGELTLGYVHDITPNRPYQTGIGAAVTFYTHPSSLTALYGSAPMGIWLFVRIRPAPMRM